MLEGRFGFPNNLFVFPSKKQSLLRGQYKVKGAKRVCGPEEVKLGPSSTGTQIPLFFFLCVFQSTIFITPL